MLYLQFCMCIAVFYILLATIQVIQMECNNVDYRHVNVVHVHATLEATIALSFKALEGFGFSKQGQLCTKTLTVLFMDLNKGFVGLLCSGKIVLVLH